MARRLCRIGDRSLSEGDALSLDGNTGAVYPGLLAVLHERPERELAAVVGWQWAGALLPVDGG